MLLTNQISIQLPSSLHQIFIVSFLKRVVHLSLHAPIVLWLENTIWLLKEVVKRCLGEWLLFCWKFGGDTYKDSCSIFNANWWQDICNSSCCFITTVIICLCCDYCVITDVFFEAETDYVGNWKTYVDEELHLIHLTNFDVYWRYTSSVVFEMCRIYRTLKKQINGYVVSDAGLMHIFAVIRSVPDEWATQCSLALCLYFTNMPSSCTFFEILLWMFSCSLDHCLFKLSIAYWNFMGGWTPNFQQ